MKVYFIVEEEMCEVYATNDGEYHREEFKNKNEALKYASKLIGRDSVTKLEVAKWNEERKNKCVFEYININGCDIIDE